MRVSAQSLGLACITAAVDISPPILPTLEPLEMFAFADDPKLRCRFIKVPAQSTTIGHFLWGYLIMIKENSLTYLYLKAVNELLFVQNIAPNILSE